MVDSAAHPVKPHAIRNMLVGRFSVIELYSICIDVAHPWLSQILVHLSDKVAGSSPKIDNNSPNRFFKFMNILELGALSVPLWSGLR